MSESRVVLKLNQQQRELIDRTVTRGEAADRQALVRRALREFAARHKPVEASADGKKN